MGRIPEYNQSQLASSYVGAAPADNSGALMTEAVQKGLSPIANYEVQKQKERTDTAHELQANNAVVDYSLAVQTGLVELQKKHAADPSKYTEATQTYLREQADAYAKGIENTTVRTKFQIAAATLQKQAIAPAIAWANSQTEANAIQAVEDTARTAAIASGKTLRVEDLVTNLNAISHTVEVQALSVTDPAFRRKTLDKYMPMALEGNLFNRAEKEPKALLKDFEGKVYDNIPYFTDKLKQEYITKAENQIRSARLEKHLIQEENASAITDEITIGQGSFTRIALAEKNEEIDHAQANKFRRALIDKVREDAKWVGKDNPEAAKYLKLAKQYIDNDVSLAEFQQTVISVWRDGPPTMKELPIWNNAKRRISRLQGSRESGILTEAVKSVLNWAGEAYSGQPDAKKVVNTAAAIKTLMNNVVSEGLVEGVGQRVIDQLRASIDPRFKQYKVGDTVSNPRTGAVGTVVSVNAQGTPMIEYEDK